MSNIYFRWPNEVTPGRSRVPLSVGKYVCIVQSIPLCWIQMLSCLIIRSVSPLMLLNLHTLCQSSSWLGWITLFTPFSASSALWSHWSHFPGIYKHGIRERAITWLGRRSLASINSSTPSFGTIMLSIGLLFGATFVSNVLLCFSRLIPWTWFSYPYNAWRFSRYPRCVTMHQSQTILHCKSSRCYGHEGRGTHPHWRNPDKTPLSHFFKKRRAILIDTLICVLFPMMFLALRECTGLVMPRISLTRYRICRARPPLRYLRRCRLLPFHLQYASGVFPIRCLAYNHRSCFVGILR